MIPPEKPPIPMQTCRYSWNMTTTDRKSQEKIQNFLKGKTQKSNMHDMISYGADPFLSLFGVEEVGFNNGSI